MWFYAEVVFKMRVVINSQSAHFSCKKMLYVLRLLRDVVPQNPNRGLPLDPTGTEFPQTPYMLTSLLEIRSVTTEIRRREKGRKKEKTTAVKYKPFGIAMTGGLMKSTDSIGL